MKNLDNINQKIFGQEPSKKTVTQGLGSTPNFSNKQNFSRFTQDSPIYPEVWRKFGLVESSERVDLILTPYKGVSANILANTIKSKIDPQNLKEIKLATSGEFVVGNFTISELIQTLLPLTKWWKKYLKEKSDLGIENLKWLQNLVKEFTKDINIKNQIKNEDNETFPIQLWSISINRKAEACIFESVPSTKADAARRVFDIDASNITWAILDSGIDATHVGFLENAQTTDVTNAQRLPKSRIIRTYNFTRFREFISNIISSDSKNVVKESETLRNSLCGFTTDSQDKLNLKEQGDKIKVIEKSLSSGNLLNWSLIEPFLRIPYDENYEKPEHNHGTHVAGILGGNFDHPSLDNPLIGMCPKIRIYDIRVLDNNGVGDEFNILAALQFIRFLNRSIDGQIIHGVNLSLSMYHEVDSFATGRTPVCETCNRLSSEGTVVVAAAGNLGQSIYQNQSGESNQGFRTSSITDPGNAELVITVGATHRSKPHTYGVSYFSSKGPTGDGRMKPDLVAPGEKIDSLAPDDQKYRMDGSSMAAPHVSGAAALLMAKHKEIIGDTKRIKEILCTTATDLGREKYFQGHGMIDVLRALQHI